MDIKQAVSIDGIEFDALISSEEEYESEVPQYPVEAGYCVSDNVTNKPLTLTMTLLISDTPVTHKLTHGVYKGRTEVVMAMLLKLRDMREPTVILTCDKTYKNMVIKSISCPKEKKGVKEIQVSFTQVTITYSVPVPITTDYGKS